MQRKHKHWKVINHCQRDPPLTTVEDPVVQANRFNDFYVSAGVAAATKTKALCDHSGFSDESVELVVPAAEDLQNANKFEFHAVTEQDIEKIVKHIPSNKTPGLIDRVSARVLKDSVPATLSVITNLINTSFASNCFAQAWKSAVVIPNLKSGDPDDPENTRPISLLPIISKVCERAAHTQFMDFFDQNSKISGLQSGNRKFHSTETALLHNTDQLFKHMDEKRISVVVLIDISKAFDSIQHDSLLSKLHLLDVSDPILAWFKSYLSSRKQVVRIGSVLSDPIPLTVGVAKLSKLSSSCLYNLRGINRIKHLLDNKTLSLIIYPLVFSNLFYCSTVWGNTSSKNISKLQLIQNFACRIILGIKKFDHVSAARKSLVWLSVRQKFQLNTVIMIHKCRTKQAPPYLCDLFHDRFKVSGRNTGNMSQLNLPKCRLSTGQRSFVFRGAKEYNLLPGNIRSTNDILSFKRKVAHFIRNSS